MTKKKSLLKKAAILSLILLLPSLFLLFFSSASHNMMNIPYYGPRQAVVKIVDGKEIVDTVYFKIPPFQMTDQNGDTLTNVFVDGNIYVADFFFATCPGICKQMSSHLYIVQEAFRDRDDFKILSFTVNPDQDTTEALKTYADIHHANDSVWRFLRAEKDSIYALAFKGYFVSAMKDSLAPGGFLHSSNLILVDREGHIRGYFDGTSTTEVGKLKDAVKLLYAKELIPRKEK